MAGHSRPKDGVASARLCPGHPRLGAQKKDVDARHKAGHDEKRMPDLQRAHHAVCALYAASSIRPSSSLRSAIFSLKNQALPAASELTSAGSADSASLISITSPEIGA